MLSENVKSSYFFTKSENYRGNYQSDIKKIDFLKIEIWNSGYRGSLRLQKLVWTLLVSNYFIVPQIKISKTRRKSHSVGPSKNHVAR